MSKTIRTYNLDTEISRKFKEQTPSRKTSEELEKLMAGYLGESKEKDQKKPVLDISGLTRKRKKLLETIMNENLFGKEYLKVKNKVNSRHGIYERKDHYKQALNVLKKTLPMKSEGSKIVAESFECDSCGDQINLSEVADMEGECLCGRTILEI